MKLACFIVTCLISVSGFGQINNNAAVKSAIPYGNNPQAGHFYKIRGFNMYVEEYGAGKPLLLIHGNGGSIAAFDQNIPYFARKYRVIAADSRAQGKSVDPGDSLSFEMMADDEAALLHQLNIDSAYVIGWSDGGIVAIEMAIRHPDNVIRFAATGADICPDSTGQAIIPSSWTDEKRDYEASRQKTAMTPDEKRHWKLLTLDWFQPAIPLSSLQSIRCPALIIGGDHDLIKIEHTVLIYQSIPQAALWIVPNSGHATLREHAADFNRCVDAFF
ncbi:MAG: alpha/beta hydrolase [Bacteroidota bacterium]|nr:alpha/beta hydrolase [Bacteroidota bacterium]